MFQTKFGVRSLVNVYRAAERANYFTTPAPGQVVSLHVSSGSLTLAGKTRSKRKTTEPAILSSADVNEGKLRLASADGSGYGAVEGVIVRVSGSDCFVAAPGEEVPIGIFGTLGQLNALGATNILYLSHTTPGTLSPTAPPSGYWLRRVIRSPKFFSKLVETEVNPDSPTAIYVRIIEEAAQVI